MINPKKTKDSRVEIITSWLDECFDSMPYVERYGPAACRKTGISLINIRGMAAEEVASILNSQFGIAVRGGFHCAGLAHKTIGTWDRGAVRIS
ncbi:MAG: aminotransferase class V-fold PLP-dependent enzyme, partial [Clostridia bacterium]|nr:aminotransferase class V-fold PLP-dependent enzyme [Clostridia bacterium]